MSLLILINVHVGDWRELFWLLLSACGSSPMSLNSFHVPLVDDRHDLISLTIFVEIPENCFVSHINEDFFLLRGDFAQECHHQVGSATIDRFGESFSSSNAQGFGKIVIIRVISILGSEEKPALPEESVGIHVSLGSQSLDGDRVKLFASEVDFCIVFDGSIQSEFGFEPRSERCEISREVGENFHSSHPQVVPDSPQHSSEIIIVSILFFWESPADFPESALVTDLNQKIRTWTCLAEFHQLFVA